MITAILGLECPQQVSDCEEVMNAFEKDICLIISDIPILRKTHQ